MHLFNMRNILDMATYPTRYGTLGTQEVGVAEAKSGKCSTLCSLVRLYESSDEAGLYVCLSHCCGDTRPLCMTTMANIEDNKRSQDKSPALSGVAKYIMKQRPGDEYLIGMWRKTLLVDLRWQACGLTKRPARWRSPPWSWASIDGEIDSSSTTETAKVRNFCTLGSASVTLAGPDPTGAVNNGELFLSTPAFVADVHKKASSESSIDTFSLQGGGLRVTFHADCCEE
jgi:hypothetical protein